MEGNMHGPIPRHIVEKNIQKSNIIINTDGPYRLVYWEDETLGVIESKDVVSVNEEKNEEGFLTGKAKYGRNAEYNVVFLVRGSNDEKLFTLAEDIYKDLRQWKERAPQTTKRQPKRRKLPDFECDSDDEVATVRVKEPKVSKDGEKKDNGEAGHKKDTQNMKENEKEEAPEMSQNGEKNKGEARNKKVKGSAVNKKKEMLLEEKKKQETSRTESLVNAEKYILHHVNIKDSDKTSTSYSNKHRSPLVLTHEAAFPSNKHDTVASALPDDRLTHLEGGKSCPKIPYSYSEARKSANAPVVNDDRTYSYTDLDTCIKTSCYKTMTSGLDSFNYLYTPVSPPNSSFVYKENIDNQFYPNNRTLQYSTNHQYQHNTAELVGDSLAVVEDSVCNQCILKERVIEDKDAQIQSITTAYDQAQNNIQSLHQRVRELEAKIAQQEASASKRYEAQGEDDVVNHYIPSRGIQVELANYQFIPVAENPPCNLERLVEMEEICVPKPWLCMVLGKCKGKGSSFTLKKLVDGFFEPEDLVNRRAVELSNTNRTMRALKLYSLNKLRMTEASFHSELNSKINSARRAVGQNRTKNGQKK